MSDHRRCKVCGEWAWFSRHTCPPVWEARMHATKWEEDWSEVHAHDAEDAASAFAKQYDQNGDYIIIQFGGAVIEVRKRGEEGAFLIDVTAESVPQYHGYLRREVTASEDNNNLTGTASLPQEVVPND